MVVVAAELLECAINNSNILAICGNNDGWKIPSIRPASADISIKKTGCNHFMSNWSKPKGVDIVPCLVSNASYVNGR